MCTLIQTCTLIHTQTAYTHPKEKEEKEEEAGELGEGAETKEEETYSRDTCQRLERFTSFSYLFNLFCNHGGKGPETGNFHTKRKGLVRS